MHTKDVLLLLLLAGVVLVLLSAFTAYETYHRIEIYGAIALTHDDDDNTHGGHPFWGGWNVTDGMFVLFVECVCVEKYRRRRRSGESVDDRLIYLYIIQYMNIGMRQRNIRNRTQYHTQHVSD